MVTVSFQITGAKEAAAKLMRFDISRIMRDEVHKGSDNILKDAKTNVHVISGRLKNSGSVRHSNTGSEGGFSMPYATTEEYRKGGRKGPNHAYLKPAVDSNGSKILDNIVRRIQSEL
jgi:hypothetical protein